MKVLLVALLALALGVGIGATVTLASTARYSIVALQSDEIVSCRLDRWTGQVRFFEVKGRWWDQDEAPTSPAR